MHPVYARLLCATMQQRGFKPDEILQGTGLTWAQLHHSNTFLNLSQVQRLVTHCLALSNCPWLGLEVGFRTQATAHGTLGAAMIASPDLPSALLLLQRYAPLRQNLASLHLHSSPSLHAVLDEWVPLGNIREYLLGQLIAGLSQLFNAFTGLELKTHVSIQWPFDQPAWAQEYQQVAHSNSFGHAHLAIYFDEALVNSVSLAADPDALVRLQRDCDLQLAQLGRGGPLAQRVRSHLTQCEGPFPLLADMAATQHMSERTFIRHLHSEQTSYQALLDEVRMERARWLLENTHRSVEDIACAVGYEDPSNFSRTFRRWLGLTPSQHRAKHAANS